MNIGSLLVIFLSSVRAEGMLLFVNIKIAHKLSSPLKMSKCRREEQSLKRG